MNKLTRNLIMVILLISIMPAVYALEQTVSLRGGVTIPVLTDLSEDLSMDPMFGFSYEAWLKDHLSLGIYPYYTSFSGKETVNDPEIETTLIGGDILAKLRGTENFSINVNKGFLERIAPYAHLGLGLAYYDNVESKLALVAPVLGAGLSFLTKWNLNLDLGVQFDHALTDKLDTLEPLDDDDIFMDSYLMPYFSLGYTFGKKEQASSMYYPRQILRNIVSMQEDFMLQGVQFEFDSANLTPEAKILLKDVVEAMKEYPNVKLEIQGYTDSTGDDKYNEELSQRRAESVRTYMVENGINWERLKAVGFGENYPIASNRTPEGRAENRRIEFRIVK